MTKRLVCLMLMLTMALAGLPALAGTEPAAPTAAQGGRLWGYIVRTDGGNEVTVYTAPEENWEQVALYAASGVRVQVLSQQDGWVHVAIGAEPGEIGRVEGYVSDLYVAIGAAAAEVPSTIVTGTVPDGTEAEVRAEMDLAAEVIAALPAGGEVQVLGQRGSWALVEMPGGFGYVRTATLMPWYADAGTLWELLFIYPGDGGDTAPLYAEMDEDTRIGQMRKGAVCHLTDMQGQWGRVEFSEMYSDLTGYVLLTDLIPNVSPNWLDSGIHVARLHPAPGEATQAVHAAPQDTARSVGTYVDGTLVEWVGTMDDGWAYVRIGFDTGFVPADRLEDTGILTNLSDRGTAVPPQGFGRLSAKDLDGDGPDSMVQVYQSPAEGAAVVTELWRASGEPVDLLADLDGWVQARLYYDFNQGFIPKDQPLEAVWLADIMPTLDAPLAPGAYTAGKDMPAGLYTLAADGQQPGTLTVSGQGVDIATAAGGRYTVYVPEGATVAFDQGMLDVVDTAQVVSEQTDWRLAGSGRFLMGVQIPGLAGLKFFANPQTDDRPGTVRIVDGALFGEPVVLEAHTLPFGQDVLVDEFPQGAFVELDNVVLTAFFGNG